MKSNWVPCCAATAILVLAGGSRAQQPADAGKAAFERVCGTCHTLQIATGMRRTRAGWQDTMEAMVSKQGAKISDEDFAPILNYLAANYNRDSAPTAPTAAAGRGAGRGRGGTAPPQNSMGAGAEDQHVVDPVAADRGRKVYAAECINCHGTQARGTDNGADLIRSVVVLHDRYSSEIGPFLRKGHPTQTTPAANLTSAQIEDLSHFIHYQVFQTLRSALDVQNVLTGDAKAGAAYFNGEGKCSGCHSPKGDLAGIASRLTPVNLQQRFLFPMSGGRGGRGGRGAAPASKPVTVTVTPAGGAAVTGVLVFMDDFNVALRDSAGDYKSFRRTPSLKVVKNDPYQAHEQLLDRITDKNMHDVVAYLEGLK